MLLRSESLRHEIRNTKQPSLSPRGLLPLRVGRRHAGVDGLPPGVECGAEGFGLVRHEGGEVLRLAEIVLQVEEFDVPILDHPFALAVTSLALVFSVTGLGLFFAVICRTQKQLEGISTLVILVMSAVGGAWFPREVTPDWFQTVGLFTLTAHAMDAFHGVLWYGKGLLPTEELDSVLPQIGVLLATGAVLLWLSFRLFRRRFQTLCTDDALGANGNDVLPSVLDIDALEILVCEIRVARGEILSLAAGILVAPRAVAAGRGRVKPPRPKARVAKLAPRSGAAPPA